MTRPGRTLARVRASATCLALLHTLACAPIDATSQVTIRPREAPVQNFGDERVSHEFVADYVQLGNRLLVELFEVDQCVASRHIPVLRVERVERRNRGFVAWDFTLGVGAGGFSALAFAQPQLFSKPLFDGQGRTVVRYDAAYVVGGVFALLSAGLLAAGVVNSVRSRNTIHYADAFELDEGPAHPCVGSGSGSGSGSESTSLRPLADRRLTLFVGEGVLEIEAHSDASGRARFVLPPWPSDLPGGIVPAQIEIALPDSEDLEPKLLELSVRAPFTGTGDAHTGRADTRQSLPTPALAPSPAAIEGPRP